MTTRNAACRLCIHCTSHDARVLPRVSAARVAARASAIALCLLLLASGGRISFAADPPPPTGTPSSVPPAATGGGQTTPLIPLPPVVAAATPDYHDAASGVDVYTTWSDDMFPAEWHDPDVAVAALPLVPTERERVLRLIKIALSKYPAALLQANLHRVYLVGGLKFEGISAAATNSLDALYIEDEAGKNGYTDRFIEDSFHHELGHLLQRNYRDVWSVDDWSKCNPADFRYGAPSGVEAVRAGHDSEEPTDDWNRRGFLCEYGASDAAEDFATIVAGLTIGDTAFWGRVDRFPALKTKVQIAIGFYAKLDDRFNEAYFRALRPSVAYVPPPPATAPPTATSATIVTAATPAPPTTPTKPDPTDPATNPAAKP